jgi:signal transduction histidine kinase
VKKNDCELCRHGVLAVLSHELRNPLAALSNSLYLLQRCQPGDAQAMRAMAVMDRQIRQLTALIDDLGDAARLGRGKVQLHRSAVDLCELLRNAGADHEALFMRCEVQISVQVPSKTVCVFADPTRLVQILGNLLHNAARFTPAGGRVVLALERDEAARFARVRVQDSGVGIDAGLRDRLFEPFSQADASLARSRGGLGLGLALVKGLVELHGGSVRAESDGPGRGSTFIVDLPFTDEKPMGTPTERR